MRNEKRENPKEAKSGKYGTLLPEDCHFERSEKSAFSGGGLPGPGNRASVPAIPPRLSLHFTTQ